jgi:predicted transcriptional regulator
MKQLEKERKSIKFLLATLIVTYQPRVALRSVSKENGVSSAKGAMFLVVSRDKIGEKSPTTFQNDIR